MLDINESWKLITEPLRAIPSKLNNSSHMEHEVEKESKMEHEDDDDDKARNE